MDSLNQDSYLSEDIRRKSRASLAIHTVSKAIIRGLGMKYYRQVWNFSKGGVRLVVADLPVPQPDCTTGVGQLLGTSVIMSVIQSLYYCSPETLKIESSNHAMAHGEYERCNLVLLGGPITNLVTRRVLNETELGEKLTWNFSDHTLYRQISEPGVKEEYTADVVKDDWVHHDFGLVVKAPSPFSPQRLIYILAGCRSFGTYAAAASLVSLKSVKKIARYSGDRSFEGVVRIDIDDTANPVPRTIKVVEWME